MSKETLQNEIRTELNKIYSSIVNSDFRDTYQIKEAFFKLIRFNENLLNDINENKQNNKDAVSSEEYFINGVKSVINNGGILNVDILRWYRDLYSEEKFNTERGLMTRIINDILIELSYKDVELTSIHNLSTDMLEE